MCGGMRKESPKRFVFASESRHLSTNSASVWNEGELWRVVGIPGVVPTGKKWKVTLEEVPYDTEWEATEDEMNKAIAKYKGKITADELSKG